MSNNNKSRVNFFCSQEEYRNRRSRVVEEILAQRHALQLQLHRDQLAEEARARRNASFRQKFHQFGEKLEVAHRMMRGICNNLVPPRVPLIDSNQNHVDSDREAKIEILRETLKQILPQPVVDDASSAKPCKAENNRLSDSEISSSTVVRQPKTPEMPRPNDSEDRELEIQGELSDLYSPILSSDDGFDDGFNSGTDTASEEEIA